VTVLAEASIHFDFHLAIIALCEQKTVQAATCNANNGKVLEPAPNQFDAHARHETQLLQPVELGARVHHELHTFRTSGVKSKQLIPTNDEDPSRFHGREECRLDGVCYFVRLVPLAIMTANRVGEHIHHCINGATSWIDRQDNELQPMSMGLSTKQC
jgi:hypothetical protein